MRDSSQLYSKCHLLSIWELVAFLCAFHAAAICYIQIPNSTSNTCSIEFIFWIL